MPPKKTKVAAKATRPVTRSVAGSVAAGSLLGSPPQEPQLQPPTQQPTVIMEPLYPSPTIAQQSQFNQIPQAFITSELASPRMSIGAMLITPGDRTVRIQSDIRRSPAYSVPPPLDYYSSQDLNAQEEEQDEERAASKDDRWAVEYEVSQIQGGSNTSKQAELNPEEGELALNVSKSTNLIPAMVYTKRRSDYLLNPRIDHTRERRLHILHNEMYPGIDVDDYWLDPEHEKQDFKHLVGLLDEFLTAIPVHGKVERFHVDPKLWMRIHRELTDCYLTRRHLEPSASLPLPPPWPGRFRTNGEDDVGEYDYIQIEELCILYRHLVETWLAQVWEQMPLTKEQRVAKLPDKYHLKWKKLLADKSTVADELKQTFGNDYEDQMEEDTIARLTVIDQERPLLSERQLKERLDYQESESELDP
ncbi:hypothetical protein M407DRAFT_34992 [Tulasnella calospora MUT 4182]|uniref:Uncharacterized protein n=1 Tax=Tulasnella calospora MUT 4182 TaxID=1051891 RepID=A0A0C3Q0G5_9AGAM|nr:hypothetical protein M407DRAFT_34992 [Tulasnella calospora MUT 4182]